MRISSLVATEEEERMWMPTEDRTRHQTLMEQADACHRLAGEALQARDPLAMHAWLDSMERALAAARLASPITTLDFEDALRDTLPSIFLPLPPRASIGPTDEDQTLVVKFGDGSTHYYHGSHWSLVDSVRRGELVELSRAELGRDVFEPSLVYVSPGWLGLIGVPDEDDRDAV